MSVQLNHTLVAAYDKQASAEFLADLLGLTVDAPLGSFVPVVLDNGVTLDFYDSAEERIATQHYAFLVSEAEFDIIFDRIQRAGMTYFADPAHERPGEINHLFGGRGAYFLDPNGHNVEILTRSGS